MPRLAPLVLAGVILFHSILLSQAPARDPVRAAGAGIMRGTVRAVDGTPLRKVLVRLAGQALRDGRALYTGDDGRYELRNLPPGRYSVTASKVGYVPGSPGQTRTPGPSIQIDLGVGQALTLDLTLWRAAAITGQILDGYGEPVPGVIVTAARTQMRSGVETLVSSARPVRSDDEATFRLYGLVPGSYAVLATRRRTQMGGPDETAAADERGGYCPPCTFRVGPTPPPRPS